MNFKIKIQYLVNGYKIITILYNIIHFYLLTINKEIKLYINIVKYLKKTCIVIS